MSHFLLSIDSPVGPLHLAATVAGLTGVHYNEPLGASAEPAPPRAAAHLKQAAEELLEYFSGKRKMFNVALAPEGTAFQRKVWAELAKIGFGETISYAALARAAGCERAVRAVGSANGRNPLAILVPCHRVIASDGSLGGYNGGLERKSWLLALERGAGAVV